MRYLIILLLVGCGSEYEPAVEWSGNITEQNESFILSYNTELFPESQLPKVEQWWIDIQTCAGVGIDISDIPLTIEYVTRSDLRYGLGGRIELFDAYTRIIQYDLNVGMNGAYTKHEMLHYLIYITKGNHKQNLDHSHIYFTLCDDVVY
jgi:hypothetical protein